MHGSWRAPALCPGDWPLLKTRATPPSRPPLWSPVEHPATSPCPAPERSLGGRGTSDQRGDSRHRMTTIDDWPHHPVARGRRLTPFLDDEWPRRNEQERPLRACSISN